jgi:hypothetical protein
MRILGINGIRSDGARNTDQLLLRLAELGWPVKDVNYPRVSVLQYWVRGRKWHRDRQYRDARHLVRAHQAGDALIAHSYGGLLALRAMELGARFSVVFLFAAACDRDVRFPQTGAERIYVVHNPRDKALCWTSLLRWHDSGALGRVGYQGPADDRIVSEEAHAVVRSSHEGFVRIPHLHHSDYFLPDHLQRWATWVGERLRAAGLGYWAGRALTQRPSDRRAGRTAGQPAYSRG